jgi:hypothetical protein
VRTLLLKADYREAAAKRRGRFPHPLNVAHTIDRDTEVQTSDGRIIAVLLCAVIPSELGKPAYRLWNKVRGVPRNRTMAMGTNSLHTSTNKDGVPSPRSGVHPRVLEVSPARQGILGWKNRDGEMSRLSSEHPEMLSDTKPLIKLVDALYAHHLPAFYALQRAEVKKAPGRLWHTAFSSIYIAKNFRTAYHVDRGNLLGTMTAIMPLGKFTGGELVLPRWRIAFAYKPGDLLFFDPQQLHGNLPFKGKRISAAFYVARQRRGEA